MRPALIALVITFGSWAAPMAATAQTPAKQSSGEIRIAPGTPATVGRNGAVSGVVPGEAVKVPEGTRTVVGAEKAARAAPAKP